MGIPYKLNGKVPKSKYTSVHICSVSKYFKDRESADLMGELKTKFLAASFQKSYTWKKKKLQPQNSQLQ